MFNIGNARIIGRRESQEDYFASLPIGEGLLCIVADGMGGYEGGEIASTASVKSFIDFFQDNFREDKVDELLVLSTHFANESLKDLKDKDNALSDMGNTLVAIYATEKMLHWINVGDSILYKFNNGQINRINANHSVAGELQEQVNQGIISQEEANNRPDRHALTSALTGYEIPHMEQSKIPIGDNDLFILASDGLHTINEKQIANILLSSQNSQNAADTLIEFVEKKNMPNQDNTTVIVFAKHKKSIQEAKKSETKDKTVKKNTLEKKPKAQNSFQKIVIIAVSTIILFLIALQIYLKFGENKETIITNLNDTNKTIIEKATSDESNSTTIKQNKSL